MKAFHLFLDDPLSLWWKEAFCHQLHHKNWFIILFYQCWLFGFAVIFFPLFFTSGCHLIFIDMVSFLLFNAPFATTNIPPSLLCNFYLFFILINSILGISKLVIYIHFESWSCSGWPQTTALLTVLLFSFPLLFCYGLRRLSLVL